MREFLFSLLVLPLIAAAQSRQLEHISTVDFGDSQSFVTQEMDIGTGEIVKVLTLGVTCRFTAFFQDGTALKFFSLDGYPMLSTGDERQAAVQAYPPYSFGIGLKKLECQCPPGRYATIGVYRWK